MARRDLASIMDVTNSAQPTKSIDVGAKTDGTVSGVALDLQGSNGQVYRSAVMHVDCDAWTDGTHTVHIEESSDNSTWNDVTSTDLVFKSGVGGVNASGQVVVDGTADDDQAYIIGYVGAKRYIRAAAVTTSSTTGAILGATLIAGHPSDSGKHLMQ